MSNEIQPTKPQTGDTAFKLWVESMEDILKLELNENARKFLVIAQVDLIKWMLTRKLEAMDRVIGATVSAVVFDEQVSPVLGAYIEWGRVTLDCNGLNRNA